MGTPEGLCTKCSAAQLCSEHAPFWQQVGIEQIISGGQTGADLGGLRAAVALGIPTGGVAPDNFWNERHPKDVEFLLKCKLTQNAVRGTAGLRMRTESNIRNSEATLIFMDVNSSGSLQTIGKCEALKKPYKLLRPTYNDKTDPVGVLVAQDFLQKVRPRILNIAGNRESKAPGIEARVEQFLVEVLK